MGTTFHTTNGTKHNDLLLIQKRDKIKRDYCKSKCFPLIVINHWERDEIGIILKDKFKLSLSSNGND